MGVRPVEEWRPLYAQCSSVSTDTMFNPSVGRNDPDDEKVDTNEPSGYACCPLLDGPHPE